MNDQDFQLLLDREIKAILKETGTDSIDDALKVLETNIHTHGELCSGNVG